MSEAIPGWLQDSLHRAALHAVESSESADRRAWRQCAALASGACTRPAIGRDSVPYIDSAKVADLKQASKYADEMLKLERERFEGEKS